MTPISLIGMGLTYHDLTATHLDIIRKADVLVGAKRHLDYFNLPSIQKIEIGKDLQRIINEIKILMNNKTVVILASGDPLFYGIGSMVIRSIGAEKIRVYPNITTVAAAFSRIKESWHDAGVVSLHGRSDENSLLDMLNSKEKIAVFTDPIKNPSWIASLLMSHQIADMDMCVMEHLGFESERIGWYPLQDVASMSFMTPNIVILKRHEMGIGKKEKSDSKLPIYIGMPEESFDHEKGLITKSEIRAVSISKLCLDRTDYVLWDLGAGSGSISIESAILLKNGQIFAVEKNPERICHIENNKRKFGIHNLEIIHAKLPEGMKGIPIPDRIFIGGGGRELKDILGVAMTYLKPGGVIVVNTVLLQNMNTSFNELKSGGFVTDLVQIQVSRCHEMPWGDRLESHNPVWIITGQKPTEVHRE